MLERWLMATAVVLLPAGGIAVAVHRSISADLFTLVVLAYVVAHLIAIPAPSGGRVSFVPAVAAAIALLGESVVLLVGAAAVALPIGWLTVHLAQGRRATAAMFPAEPLGLAVFSALFAAGTVGLFSPEPTDLRVLGVLAVSAVGWYLAATVARSLLAGDRFTLRRLAFLQALEDWPAYLVLFSSATLFALTVEPMGAWSVLLAGLPYVFSHLSLQRLRTTRHTYGQTIEALGRLPEAAGLVPRGHGRRCADLAVAVAAEVGISAGALRRVEFAGLLHDIGRVVLANPAVATGSYGLSDLSRWSSTIIAEARYLEPVAVVVAALHQPYRRPGQARDEDTPRESQVIKVVAGYEEETERGTSPIEAIEELHRGAAYDYDPEVVGALRRVLERRGVLAG